MIRLLPFATLIAFVLAASGCDDIPDPSLPNEPPLAMDDSFDILQNEITIVDVLANDVDIDGDPLQIEILQQPVNGTLENSDGLLVYTPSLYYIGSDQFTYQITDLVGHTATASVAIEILRKEVRAVFSTQSDGVQRVYSIDSRAPDTLVDLAQAVPTGENVVAWEISEALQQVLLLTDADRLLAVAFDDPSVLAGDYAIDTTNGAIDGGLVLSNAGDAALISLDNRYLFAVNLVDGETVEFDSGFANGSTMSPQFFNATDNSVVMTGTLGMDAEERSAIYTVVLTANTALQVLDDAGSLDQPFARLLTGLNSMLWLTISDTTPVPPAAYSCNAPPAQVYSAPFYSLLTILDSGNDLIEASGVLAEPVSVISYHGSDPANSLLIAACPSGTELFQIVQVPYLEPSAARLLATAADASDGLWNLDVAESGSRIIYAVEGDSGFRVVSVDLSESDPVVTDLTASVTGYQSYTAGMTTRVPPSMISTDRLRWVYLVPESGALTQLAWLQLNTDELTTLALPFTATNVTSDGLFALVQGQTGTDAPAPVALVELAVGDVTPVEVPGILAEFVDDPLNQVTSAIRLIRAP